MMHIQNFHSIEVVDRVSETQLQVGESEPGVNSYFIDVSAWLSVRFIL